MKMVPGDINIYYKHVDLTPGSVRAASYGTDHNSGTLLPELGDVINQFPGRFGEPARVRVTKVESIGRGVEAYEVTVQTVPAHERIMADGVAE